MASKKVAVSVKATLFNIGGEKVKAVQFTDFGQFIADIKRLRIKESIFKDTIGTATCSAGDVTPNDWFVYLDASSYFILSNKWFKKLAKVWAEPEMPVDEEDAPSEHPEEKGSSMVAESELTERVGSEFKKVASEETAPATGDKLMLDELAEGPAKIDVVAIAKEIANITDEQRDFEIKKILYTDQIVTILNDNKMKKIERVEIANRLVEKMTDEQKTEIRNAVNAKMGYRAMYTPPVPVKAPAKQNSPWNDAARKKEQQNRQPKGGKPAAKETVAVVKRLVIR